MKTRTKRALALVLSLCMMISLLPVSVFAEAISVNTPTITNVTINGNLVEGQTLTVDYDFTSSYEGGYDDSAIAWYLVDGDNLTPIGSGETLDIYSSYSPVGKYIKVEVTPIDLGGTGTAATATASTTVSSLYAYLNSVIQSGTASDMGSFIDNYLTEYMNVNGDNTDKIAKYDALVDKSSVYAAVYSNEGQAYSASTEIVTTFANAVDARYTIEQKAALAAINSAVTQQDMASAINTYHGVIPLNSTAYANYVELSNLYTEDSELDYVNSVLDSLIAPMFEETATYYNSVVYPSSSLYFNDSFYSFVGQQIGVARTAALSAINDVITSADMTAVIEKWYEIFGIDETDYATYESLADKSDINGALLEGKVGSDYSGVGDVTSVFQQAIASENGTGEIAGELEALVAVNSATTVDAMKTAITTYAETLDIKPVEGEESYFDNSLWEEYQGLSDSGKEAVYEGLIDNAPYSWINDILFKFRDLVTEQRRQEEALEVINAAATATSDNVSALEAALAYFAARTDLYLDDYNELATADKYDILVAVFNGTDYASNDDVIAVYDAAIEKYYLEKAVDAVNSCTITEEIGNTIIQNYSTLGIDLMYYYGIESSDNQAAVLQAMLDNANNGDYEYSDAATLETAAAEIVKDFTYEVAKYSVTFSDVAEAVIALTAADVDEIGDLLNVYSHTLRLDMSCYNLLTDTSVVDSYIYNMLHNGGYNELEGMSYGPDFMSSYYVYVIYSVAQNLGFGEMSLDTVLSAIATYAEDSSNVMGYFLAQYFYGNATYLQMIVSEYSYEELYTEIDIAGEATLVAINNATTTDEVLAVLNEYYAAYEDYLGLEMNVKYSGYSSKKEQSYYLYMDEFNALDSNGQTEVLSALLNENFGIEDELFRAFNTEVAIVYINNATTATIGSVLDIYGDDLLLNTTAYDLLYDKSTVNTALVSKSFVNRGEVQTAYYNAVEAEETAEKDNVSAAITALKAVASADAMKDFFAPTDANNQLYSYYLGLDTAFDALPDAYVKDVMTTYFNGYVNGGYGSVNTKFDSQVAFERAVEDTAVNLLNGATDAASVETILKAFKDYLGIDTSYLTYLSEDYTASVYTAILGYEGTFLGAMSVQQEYYNDLVIATLNYYVKNPTAVTDATALTVESLIEECNWDDKDDSSYYYEELSDANKLAVCKALMTDGFLSIQEYNYAITDDPTNTIDSEEYDYDSINEVLQVFGKAVLLAYASEDAATNAATKLKLAEYKVASLVETQYTATTWTAFKAAYAIAEALPETTYDEIKAKATAINAALALLVHVITIGDETTGGIGYTRVVTADSASVTTTGRYFLVQVTEGSGTSAKVSLVMVAADSGTTTISYATKGATVQVWLVSAMPTSFSGSTLGGATIYATATTASAS